MMEIKFRAWNDMLMGKTLCEGCGHLDIWHSSDCELAYKMRMAWHFNQDKCLRLLVQSVTIT